MMYQPLRPGCQAAPLFALADKTACYPVVDHVAGNVLHGHYSLYRMVMTTITVAEIDLRAIKDAEIGDFTLYHWIRMLAGKIAKIMTYEPLMHSLTISLGATMLALTIGGLMAWMVVRTDMPGREIVHILATIPYIMPSWTIAMAWTVLFKNRTSGGTPGCWNLLPAQPHQTGWHMDHSRS